MTQSIAVATLLVVCLASPGAGQAIRNWWEYKNADAGIRFVYPAHWSAKRHSEGNRVWISVGPSHEDTPISVTLMDRAEAEREASISFPPDAKVTMVTVGGQREKLTTYYVDRSGYRCITQVYFGNKAALFFCNLDSEVPEAEEAFYRLLKSFRFIPDRR